MRRTVEQARAQSAAIEALEAVFAAYVSCRDDLRDARPVTIAHEGLLRLASEMARETFAELRRQVRDR